MGPYHVHAKHEGETNAAAYVSSGLHLSIGSKDPDAVFALSEFYENVRHSNKLARTAQKEKVKRFQDLKRESEYHRKKPRVGTFFSLSLSLFTAKDVRI